MMVLASPQAVNPAEEISDVPALPQTPAAVNELLVAQPFKLENGYAFEWHADRPLVRSGWLLVLKVNPALVFPRQTAEPILFVGDISAERVNIGHQSGRIVVIVPSEIDKHGEMKLDLSKAPMWFGTPGLPEQVDAERVEFERMLADRAQIKPASAAAIATAREKGGAMLNFSSREMLRKRAGVLIQEHSPQETELIESIMADAAAVESGQAAIVK
jgi:hypothetical protein